MHLFRMRRRSEGRDGVKVLSIRQPWAWAILYAFKDIENRTWWPPRSLWGQRIVIHAGKRIDAGDLDAVEDICGVRPPPRLRTGALLGTVGLVDAVDVADCAGNKWAFGPVCFRLRDARPWPTPITCSGQLNFFEPGEESFLTGHDFARYRVVLNNVAAKAKKEPIAHRLAELRMQIRKKGDNRMVECEQYMDFAHSSVEVHRLDTGEVVEQRTMEADEHQVGLAIVPPAPDVPEG